MQAPENRPIQSPIGNYSGRKIKIFFFVDKTDLRFCTA